jgi:hypothetical protein
MSKLLEIVVDENGNLRAIHDDELTPLFDHGTVHIERASHVEPNTSGQWIADLSPVNGPELGPFTLRQTALDAEVAYLRANVL